MGMNGPQTQWVISTANIFKKLLAKLSKKLLKLVSEFERVLWLKKVGSYYEQKFFFFHTWSLFPCVSVVAPGADKESPYQLTSIL